MIRDAGARAAALALTQPLGLPARAGAAEPRHSSASCVILGFDGMDPDARSARWMKEGKLPNIASGSPNRRRASARDHALARVADGVGVVRHRRQSRASTTSTTSSCATPRPTCPISAWCGASRARFLFDYVPIAKPKLFSIRGGTSFWVTAGQAGVRSSILTVPVTFPPEDVPNGELLVGPAAAGHPRHDGHLLLLRDRPEPLRRGQHRVRRHPQAARDRERRRAHASSIGPPNPIVRQQIQAIRAQGADAERRRPRDARRAPGAGGRARCR